MPEALSLSTTPKHGDYTPALAQLKDIFRHYKRTSTMTAYIEDIEDMALFQVNLADLRGEVEGATGPSPKASDLASNFRLPELHEGYYGWHYHESEGAPSFIVSVRTGGSASGLARVCNAKSVMLEKNVSTPSITPLLAIFLILQLPIQVRRATRQNSQPIEPPETDRIEKRRLLSFGSSPMQR